jgi:hypothetical protein
MRRTDLLPTEAEEKKRATLSTSGMIMKCLSIMVVPYLTEARALDGYKIQTSIARYWGALDPLPGQEKP